MSNEERIIKQAQTIQRKKMEKFAEKFIRKINEQIFISNNNSLYFVIIFCILENSIFNFEKSILSLPFQINFIVFFLIFNIVINIVL